MQTVENPEKGGGWMFLKVSFVEGTYDVVKKHQKSLRFE